MTIAGVAERAGVDPSWLSDVECNGTPARQEYWARIAIGNEACAYCRLVALDVNRDRPWARLYQLRCWLAHDRLPDVEEDFVWRMSKLGVVSVCARVRAMMR